MLYPPLVIDGAIDLLRVLQVLQEAISNEDDARCAPTVDELGPEAALLYEELRERQELMVSGQWDIENSFDDFRLVIGDNTL